MKLRMLSSASLDALKGDAKRWHKALLAGNTEARAEFARAYPRAPALPVLREVQQALAREYGFGSWAALKQHVLERATPQQLEQRAGLLLELACLSFGHDEPARSVRARKLLDRYPELSRVSIHTAAACGDRAHVERVLCEDPSAARRKGGPQGWEPLLFVCYSRLPGPELAEHALAIVELLLAHGADPGTSFHMGDNARYRFTALCGVLGAGDGVGPAARPPHPRAAELARYLLARGAPASDGQAIYDTMLSGDDTWLLLLIEHGLGPEAHVEWAAESDAPTLFEFVLRYAAERGHVRLARTVLEHGANPNGHDANGRSYLELALRGGHEELAALLVQQGARAVTLAASERVRAECMGGSASIARDLLAEHPECLDDATLLIDAASRDRAEIVQVLLDLGMSPDAQHPKGYRALHVTACDRAPNAARVLLERGATVDIVDPNTRSTPLGWALYTSQRDMIDLIAPYSHDPWTLVMAGRDDRLRDILSSDPNGLAALPGKGGVLLHHLPDDTARAEALLELLLTHGADVRTPNDQGQSAAASLRARGSLDIAELVRARGG
jgi:ankyrin repeat protein